MSSSGNIFNKFVEKLSSNKWSRAFVPARIEENAVFSTKEKVVVFIISFTIALSLWVMVNLDRDYNLTLDLELIPGVMEANMALTSPLPKTVSVSINGEGWKLINMYNNPPRVPVNLESGTVNLFEQVRELILTYPDLSVTKVQPSIVNVNLEEEISRKVPVNPRLDISFRSQFNFVGGIETIPDSITITGARSRVEDITVWQTTVIRKEGLRESIDMVVPLLSPSDVLQIDRTEVRLRARVSEFTEGEVRVPIRTRGLPRGRQVTYSPAAVSIRYDVPIDEYVEAQNITPYAVYVNYSQIINDTTGFVSPMIEQTADDLNLRFRSANPRIVSYYTIITGN